MDDSNDAAESALEALKRYAAALTAWKEAIAAEAAKIRVEGWPHNP
jgi:hypothetical protein